MRALSCNSLLAAAAIALAFTPAASIAQEPKPQAVGRFEGQEWTFEVAGAYAFPAEVGMDDEPGIRVAVSNSTFSAERLDRVWDREHAIDTFIADDETLVVYFHFARDGKYEGMTYYFGPGDGCGYCFDPAVKSTVEVGRGRIHGRFTLAPQPDEVSFDVELDVPVAPSDYGEPLPAGGGELGAVYARYHQVLAGTDPEALRPFLDEADAGDLAQYGVQVLTSKRESHPTKSYEVQRGWIDGDWALLLVKGENAYTHVETEVHLLELAGSWRVYDEILRVKLGD